MGVIVALTGIALVVVCLVVLFGPWARCRGGIFLALIGLLVDWERLS
jgi:hypothetical protein